MSAIVEDKKKYLGSLLFLAALIGATFYVFLKGNDLGALMATVRAVNPVWLLAAVASMFLYIASEATSIKIVLGSLGRKLPFLRCYKYSFIGFYYSSITPSASGGQPMQLYHMKKDGVNLSHSSLTILILISVYQVVQLGYALVTFLLRPQFVGKNAGGIWVLLLYGVVINVILLGVILTAVFSQNLARRMVRWGGRVLHKLHILKDPQKLLDSVDEQISEYRDGAKYLRQKPGILLGVLLATIFQLSFTYLVPYFVYRAFGFTQFGMVEVLAMQAILALAVGSLPLPGAVGASEGGFMTLFKIFFPTAALLPAMMLSRGISFYLMLLISGGVAIFAQLGTIRRAVGPAAKPSSSRDCCGH